MSVKIDIVKVEKLWNGERWLSKSKISTIATEVIKLFPNFVSVMDVEFAIVLTNNDQMRALNHEFLDKDRPTNVLSFPEAEFDYKRLLEFIPPQDYIKLGDIAFGYQIILEEAKEQDKKFEHHFVHLLIHGILHLFGFDHEIEEDARAMQSKEIDLLKLFSIPSPY